MNKITVVVISRESEDPYTTLCSLADQTIPFDLVVVYDENKGANWARNKGFEYVQTPYVLFSDNDICWEETSLEVLLETLENNIYYSYAYCSYLLGGDLYCNLEFSAQALRQGNYISTMSLIRTKDFPGFDESIQRLQDWDLYLTMLEQGKIGVYCEKTLFVTYEREGITYGPGITWEEAELIVRKKHNL